MLSTLVCLFSQYCDVPFSVEQVEVTYEASGKVEVTPNLASWQSEASLDYINTLVGERLSSQTVCSLLERMQLSAAYDGSRGQVNIAIFLHPNNTRSMIILIYFKMFTPVFTYLYRSWSKFHRRGVISCTRATSRRTLRLRTGTTTFGSSYRRSRSPASRSRSTCSPSCYALRLR